VAVLSAPHQPKWDCSSASELGNREIGELLHISTRTVEKHIAALLTKLDVPDRPTLIERIR
jgi:DNA-binding CsgD family transcriptional regulator